jgi:hypothetical protein
MWWRYFVSRRIFKSLIITELLLFTIVHACEHEHFCCCCASFEMTFLFYTYSITFVTYAKNSGS